MVVVVVLTAVLGVGGWGKREDWITRFLIGGGEGFRCGSAAEMTQPIQGLSCSCNAVGGARPVGMFWGVQGVEGGEVVVLWMTIRQRTRTRF